MGGSIDEACGIKVGESETLCEYNVGRVKSLVKAYRMYRRKGRETLQKETTHSCNRGQTSGREKYSVPKKEGQEGKSDSRY